MNRSVFAMKLGIFALMAACGSSDSSSDDPSTGSTGKAHDAGGGATGHVQADAGGGSHAVADAGANVPPVTTSHADAGHPTTTTTPDAATVSTHADASAPTGSGDAGGMGTSDAGATGGTASGTTVTGTLGALGAAMPIMGALFISTGSETIVYLSSAPLPCSMISGRDGSKWLVRQPAGSQVVELVVPGAAKVGAASFAEVNYAPGGMSSAYEKSAALGSAKLSFTKVEAMSVLEGTFSATYANPTGSVNGTFHAEFCADGQEY